MAYGIALPVESVQNVLTRSAHGEEDIILVGAHALGGVAFGLGAVEGGHVFQIGIQHVEGFTALADSVAVRRRIVGILPNTRRV